MLAGLVLIPSGWEASGRRLGAARRAPRQPAVVASAGLQEGLQEEVWKATLREAGLEEAQAEELWERRPPGRLPGVARQAALLEWLQSELADDEPVRHSYLCLSKAPKLMLKAGALPQLQESLGMLREQMGQLTPRQFSFLVAHTPELLLVPAPQLRENATWVGATVGLGATQLHEVLTAAPKLLLAKRAAVQKNLEWLERQLDLADPGRLQRVVCNAPLCLLLSAEKTMEGCAPRPAPPTPRLSSSAALPPPALTDPPETAVRLGAARRVAYLRSVGVGTELLTSLVLCTPTLLHSPLDAMAQRLAWWTDEAGVAAADLPALLGRSPKILGLGPNRCRLLHCHHHRQHQLHRHHLCDLQHHDHPLHHPLHRRRTPHRRPHRRCEAMVTWLERLGLSRAEALTALRAEPAILEQKEEQLQLKAAFFCDVIGGSPAELAQVPLLAFPDLPDLP